MASGTKRGERTVYVTAAGPEGVAVRDMVAEWSKVGIVKGSLWVTPDDVVEQAHGSPPVVDAVEINGGTQLPVDLFRALGTHALSSVRLVVVHLITSPAATDGQVLAAGRTVEREIRASLPRRANDETGAASTRLRLLNVLIPVSGAAYAPTEMIMPGWDINVVVSPEDRPDLDRSTVFVRHPGNFVGHAAAALSALGGLLEGMDEGALDHLELDSTSRDDDLLLARFTVRAVVGDDIVETLAEQTFDLSSFGGDGPGSLLADTRVAADPISIATFAADHVLASDAWHSEAEPAGPRAGLASRGLWRAILHAIRFNVRMFGVMFKWFLNRLRISVEHRATRIIVGEDAGIAVRIGAGPADGIAEAAEHELARVDAQHRAAALTPRQQLVHVNPAAWTLVREMATSLVDGSELPLGFPEPRVSGRREVLPPGAVVPDPEDTWTTLDKQLIRPLDVRGAKVYEVQLETLRVDIETQLEALDSLVTSCAALVEADRKAIADLVASSKKKSKEPEAKEPGDDDGDAEVTPPPADVKNVRAFKRLEASLAKNEKNLRKAQLQRDELKQALAEVAAEQKGFAAWLGHVASYMRTLIEDRTSRLDAVEAEIKAESEAQTSAPPRERLVKRQKVVRIVWSVTLALMLAALGYLGWVIYRDEVQHIETLDRGDMIEAAGIIIGIALLIFILANHAFYRAVRAYEWALAQLIARRRADIERSAWRRTTLSRLMVQERAMSDWGRILGEVVHHPWGDTARETRTLDDTVVQDLPASMGVAGLSHATSMPFQSTAAAARAVYVKGWLGRAFESIASDFDDVEIGNETGFSSVDADTSDRPTGPRMRFVEHLENRGSRRSATELAMRRFRDAIDSHEIPIPTRTVRRRGPFTDGEDIDEPGYFTAAAGESITFAADGFTAVGRQRLAHYVARAAVWLPTSVGAAVHDTEMKVMPAHGANAVRVDLSRRLAPSDLLVFGESLATASLPLVNQELVSPPGDSGEVWV